MIASEEGVATNLLSQRLKLLESLEVITKRKLPQNQKENIYLLTQKGIDLAPMIMEIVLWSDKYVRSYNTEMNAYETKDINKSQVIESVQNEYKKWAFQIVT
jgi:DNA-binding HxlR family transcriptional regulator